MPIHNWTRVSPGTWHDFHLAWISELRKSLNDGRRPPDHYAQSEPVIGPFGPDVLTLQIDTPPQPDNTRNASSGGIAVALRPPRPALVGQSQVRIYAPKQRRIVIRHVSDDRIIALMELVSPGNKAGQKPFRRFIRKAVAAVHQCYHR
jgi:hypothetical protein